MGTILASAIISKAQTVLQDPNAVRWSQAELLGWANDAQREISAFYPDLSAVTGNVTLVAGPKQSLPSGASLLIKLLRNMGVGGSTPGPAIRQVGRQMLDASTPDWYTQDQATTIKHFTYDPKAQHVFYVYPPSVANNVVEALYVIPPADMANVNSAINVDDVYANLILDYVLFRAFSKDLELAGAAENAAVHRRLFDDALAAKKTVNDAVTPQEGSRTE